MKKELKFIIIPLSTFLIGMMVGKYIEKSNHICQEIIISDTLEENVAETTQTIAATRVEPLFMGRTEMLAMVLLFIHGKRSCIDDQT